MITGTLSLLFSQSTFWFVTGLIVGWNFLSQPAWVKRGLDASVATVKGWFSKS